MTRTQSPKEREYVICATWFQKRQIFVSAPHLGIYELDRTITLGTVYGGQRRKSNTLIRIHSQVTHSVTDCMNRLSKA
jgi:hypothetical protein